MTKPFTLHLGDCLDSLRAMPDNSVDSIVTDPPYGLTANKKGGSGTASVNLDNPYGRSRIGTGNGAGGFMGHKWDSDVPSVEIWAECLRVLKPGGHLLAFAGTRTQHRMAVRIEDAGFEIRDMIAWVYGSGFPKSLDVSKAIDKAAGPSAKRCGSRVRQLPTAATPETCARQWQGWGTALKPALEPITVARKQLAGTVAANVQEHGTGALNIDGCRVGNSKDVPASVSRAEAGNSLSGSADGSLRRETGLESGHNPNVGRWPANLIHDGSDEVLAAFPQAKGQQGALTGAEPSSKTANAFGEYSGRAPSEPRGDAGSAARFFYCAKASRKDRNEGLPSSDTPAVGTGATMREREDADWPARNGNHHPTVKPTDLMRYLCRLVTPPGGVVLDPFMGSGSTGKAAMLEGFKFIGCELSTEYLAIAQARIEAAIPKPEPAEQPPQMDMFAA